MRYGSKPTDPFYASAAWRRVRKAVLMRDNYMCVRCMQAYRDGHGGRPRAATLVHHIVAYQDAPELALDMANLESLCEACHNQVHNDKGARNARPITADTPPDLTPVRIICI